MIEKRRGRSEPSAHLAGDAEGRFVVLRAAFLSRGALLVVGHGPVLVAAAESAVEAPMA